MVKRIGTARRKTRHKYQKGLREKGKISLTKYFQEFKQGEKVVLKPESALQKGLIFRRFVGKSGIIKNKTGNCYNVIINDQGKEKTVIAHPVHLKRV